MTPEATIRRAIASRHWQWLPGCLLTYGDCLDPSAPRKQYRVLGGDLSAHVLSGDPLPVTDDAATVGCLLALARKAWGDPCLHARMVYKNYPLLTREWLVPVESAPIARSFRAATEAEVLLIALGAAEVTPKTTSCPPDPRLTSRPDAGRWDARFDAPTHQDQTAPRDRNGRVLTGTRKRPITGDEQ